VAQKVALTNQTKPVLVDLLKELSDPSLKKMQDSVAGYARAMLAALPAMERQAAYLRGLGTGDAAGTKFAYLSAGGLRAIADAIDLALGNTGARPGMSAEAYSLMRARDLTDAEVAAIKIYTADDYRYMNPALEGNRGGWLEDQVKAIEGRRPDRYEVLGAALPPGHQGPLSPADVAAQEGLEHAKVAVEGLRKLPPWSGTTYRGMGLTPDEFKTMFEDTNVWSARAFTSTTVDRSVSEGFAAANGKKPGKIGIFLIFTVTDGRDVKKLSVWEKEGEILLIPGAKGTITGVRDSLTHPGVKEVFITQTG
jgi:hypothetical protein